jgi:membrane protein DedA with SNARE-associated domain/membrane-associated phospholipid phosphatase
MEHLLKSLILWTYYHSHWAGLMVFLIATAESVAVLGTLIPGTIVMTGIGTLIGAGILPFYTTILWAGAGAFFGDSASFITGYILKQRIREIWPFNHLHSWLDKGERFFNQHGKKSIFIARFLGPMRAFVPIIAGALQMNRLQFFITDAISAILWAIVYMLPGMLIGAATLDLQPALAIHVVWWVFSALLGALVLYWIGRLLVIHVNDVITDLLTRCWQSIKQRASLSWFAIALQHHKKDHPRGQLGLLFIIVLILLLLIILTLHVIYHGPLTAFNQGAYHFSRSIHNLPTDKVMLFITELGGKHTLLLPGVIGAVWLSYKRCWRAAIHWLALFVFAYLSVGLLKHTIQNPRPPGLAIPLTSFSYPSGHSTLSTAIFGFLAFLVASRCPAKTRWTCYLTAACIVLPVLISRIYLGAHWLTDVCGGCLLGLFWVLVIGLSYHRKPSQRIGPIGLLVSFTLALILSASHGLYHYFSLDLQRFQPVQQQQEINLAQWWQRDTQHQPFYEVNRFGKPTKILNIQWASDPSTITTTLGKNGWHKPVPDNWVTAIQHPNLSHKYAIHVKTSLFHDRKPDLVLVKRIGEKHTLLLKLWDTSLRFNPPTLQLWVGALTVHTNQPQSTNIQHDQKLHQQLLEDNFLNDINQPFTVRTEPLKQSTAPNHASIIRGQRIYIKPLEPLS